MSPAASVFPLEQKSPSGASELQRPPVALEAWSCLVLSGGVVLLGILRRQGLDSVSESAAQEEAVESSRAEPAPSVSVSSSTSKSSSAQPQ